MFREYIDAGWVLCRIKPGTKGPADAHWQHRESGIADPARADAFMSAGLCHAWSGTCALDVDNWDVAEKFLDQRGIVLQALFDDPTSVQIQSGKKGRGKLLYRLATPRPTLKLAPYKAPSKKDPAKEETYHGIELRCATAGGLTMQDVLPPSIHPETGLPYRWAYGDPLLGHWSQLPELPAVLADIWHVADKVADTPEAPKERRGATIAELQAIVAGQDNDDYENWIRVGNILHHETSGSMAGFGVWDGWSRSSSKYKGSVETQNKWNSFGKNEGNIATLGSLLQEKVATLDEFGLTSEAPQDKGTDTRLSTEIDGILQRVVYLLDQERYYHHPLPRSNPGFREGLDTAGDQALKGAAFDVLYARHMPNEVIIGKNGEEKIKKMDPRQSVRFSNKVPKVNGIGFHPGAGRIYTEEDGKQYLNEYEAPVIESLRPKPVEREAWEFLINRIIDPTFRRWLLKFYAHALAKPGVKIQAAPLLVSETKGTGKTTLTQTVPALVFGRNWVKEISPEILNKDFNSFLAGAWWVTIEELKTDGPKMDRAHLANKLKPWITSATIPVEFKGLNVYHIQNRVQLLASSNFRYDALHLDNDDRRWGVANVVEQMLTEAEKTSLFGDFLNSPRAPGVLRWLLQQENLTGFSPHAVPPDTVGKREMVSSGLGQWETTIAEAMTYGKAPFDRDILEPQAIQDSLRGLGNVSLKRIGALIRRAPFNATAVHTFKGTLYCWRNQKKWKHYCPNDWIQHIETGARLDGGWSVAVPLAIRQAAGEDGEDEDLTDLLGDING